ncbi:cyclase family protein [Sphingosinicella sp. LHD-64]|uniref:cyclase family protein n=1 Tax=Sphingosinicella sp. LHD-64 TaxID=3072139 RepID=UPI00280EC4A6|nr:cyclase family protein [Sphingosinicella sp. LHD-64]MDQ8758298.1 cyclase family protein [Sphingosinicella sp. LHD-64]
MRLLAAALAPVALATFLLFAAAGSAMAQSQPVRLYDLGRSLAAYHPAAAGTERRQFIPVDPAAPYPEADGEPADVRVSYTGRFVRGSRGFFSGDLHFWDHTGTHVDAPRHYVPEGAEPERQRSIGELELSQLHGPLVIIDTSGRADRNVTAQDIDRVRARLVGGAWLLANLGHAGQFGASGYNADTAPGFTLEACERLSQLIDAGEAEIAGIGADNGGVDRIPNFQSIQRSCHGLLLPRNIPLIENLGDLSAVSADPGACELIVAPMKVVGASGAPARVFARCE